MWGGYIARAARACLRDGLDGHRDAAEGLRLAVEQADGGGAVVPVQVRDELSVCRQVGRWVVQVVRVGGSVVGGGAAVYMYEKP